MAWEPETLGAQVMPSFERQAPEARTCAEKAPRKWGRIDTRGAGGLMTYRDLGLAALQQLIPAHVHGVGEAHRVVSADTAAVVRVGGV